MQFAAPIFNAHYGWLWLIATVTLLLFAGVSFLLTKKDEVKYALIFSATAGIAAMLFIGLITLFTLDDIASSSYSREVASKIESLAPVTVLDDDRENLRDHEGSFLKEINLVANKSTTSLECRVLRANDQYTITCKKPSSEEYVSVEEGLADR